MRHRYFFPNQTIIVLINFLFLTHTLTEYIWHFKNTLKRRIKRNLKNKIKILTCISKVFSQGHWSYWEAMHMSMKWYLKSKRNTDYCWWKYGKGIKWIVTCLEIQLPLFYFLKIISLSLSLLSFLNAKSFIYDIGKLGSYPQGPY